MSMSSSQMSIGTPVEVLFLKEESVSSVEPPREEWSSLRCLDVPYVNPKKILADEGLYDPGSGEICTKYVPMSDSSVFRHPYRQYPAVVDPGIVEALNDPAPKVSYFNDGQELYLLICDEMGERPISLFHKNLLEEKIDLSYYGISPSGFRPIAMALGLNRIVKVLDLTSNWISQDGCFHLGEMLMTNTTLTELILSGCRIGPKGALCLSANLHINKALCKLDLCKNQMGDEGVEYLAKAIYNGADITELNLSYNDLSDKSCFSLAEALELNKKLTHLDLSWNSLLSPKAFEMLCIELSESKVLTELNFAWSSLGPRFSFGLEILLKTPKLTRLDLSNNKLTDDTMSAIARNLPRAKKLEWLNLSSNPISPKGAEILLPSLRLRRVKLNTLLLDHVRVSEEFLAAREVVLSKPFREKTIITYGDVTRKFVPKLADMREIVLKSAVRLCSKPKKQAVDVCLLFLGIQKEFPTPLSTKDFLRVAQMAGAFQLNEGLIDEMAAAFPGPRMGKIRKIDIEALVEYCKRKWPDKKLPPTPPPEPEPAPVLKKKDNRKK